MINIERLDCFGVAFDKNQIAVCFSRWCGQTDCYTYERDGIKIPIRDIKNLLQSFGGSRVSMIIRKDFYFLDENHPHIQETDIQNAFILGLISGGNASRNNVVLFKDFIDDYAHFKKQIGYTKKFNDNQLIKRACCCAWSFQEKRHAEIRKFIDSENKICKGLI